MHTISAFLCFSSHKGIWHVGLFMALLLIAGSASAFPGDDEQTLRFMQSIHLDSVVQETITYEWNAPSVITNGDAVVSCVVKQKLPSEWMIDICSNDTGMAKARIFVSDTTPEALSRICSIICMCSAPESAYFGQYSVSTNTDQVVSIRRRRTLPDTTIEFDTNRVFCAKGNVALEIRSSHDVSEIGSILLTAGIQETTAK